VSQFEPTWQCWDPDAQERWVRPLPQHPGVVSDPDHFPFFFRGMEFEDFVPKFGYWYAQQHGGRLTACLVAIRSDESLNRFRTVAMRHKTMHEGLAWTTWIGGAVFNAYPIYDWRTQDDWRFYGKERVPYNRIYDLMHKAGISIHQARLCQPYGDDQRKGLWLYHVLEPETWGRVVARVQGVGFGARYARESGNVLGRIKVVKPDALTWEQYSMALLASMPQETAEAFRTRIAWFLEWHRRNGHPDGVIPDDGPMDRTHPSWKRICKVILGYDYYCKGLTFSPPTSHEAYRKYKATMASRRAEWGYLGRGL
jgi:predicted phosphoadenosine phosphosulfate sulfurtransferase